MSRAIHSLRQLGGATLLVVSGVIQLSACDDRREHAPVPGTLTCSKADADEARTLRLDGCITEYPVSILKARCSRAINGIREFMPLRACFETLSQEEISGIWLYGFEASYFVMSLAEIDDRARYLGEWLIHSERAADALGPLPNDGELRAFRVRFLGVRPDTIGMPVALYGKVYYAQKILSAEEIHDPFGDAEAVPPNKSLERSRDR